MEVKLKLFVELKLEIGSGSETKFRLEVKQHYFAIIQPYYGLLDFNLVPSSASKKTFAPIFSINCDYFHISEIMLK